MGVAAHRFDNDRRYRAADHPSQTWFTPAYVLDRVRDDFGGDIDLDPCTTADNPVGAYRWFTPTEDGLSTSWDNAGSVFVNPPYSKAREPWVNKCIAAGDRGQAVILLIPAATDTRIFQKAAASASEIVFIKGRVKFGVLRPNRRQVAASHPSALLGWNTKLNHCATLGLRCVAADWWVE